MRSLVLLAVLSWACASTTARRDTGYLDEFRVPTWATGASGDPTPAARPVTLGETVDLHGRPRRQVQQVPTTPRNTLFGRDRYSGSTSSGSQFRIQP